MAYDDNSDFEQDFDPYAKKDEQDQLSQRLSALEQNLATAAQQIAPHLAYVEAQAASNSRLQVVEKLSKELDGFEAFYGSEHARNFLSARPALAKAISIAEGAAFQADLEQLYTLAWEASKAHQVVSQADHQGQEPSQPQMTPAQQRIAGFSRDPSAGPQMQRSQQADLSTPEKRRAYIEGFEKKHGDVPI